MKLELIGLMLGFSSLIMVALDSNMSRTFRILVVILNLFTIIMTLYLIHYSLIEIIGMCNLS
jgi:hypothetical protein